MVQAGPPPSHAPYDSHCSLSKSDTVLPLLKNSSVPLHYIGPDDFPQLQGPSLFGSVNFSSCFFYPFSLIRYSANILSFISSRNPACLTLYWDLCTYYIQKHFHHHHLPFPPSFPQLFSLNVIFFQGDFLQFLSAVLAAPVLYPLRWVERCHLPPPKTYVHILIPEPVNVALVGKRVFIDIIKF